MPNDTRTTNERQKNKTSDHSNLSGWPNSMLHFAESPTASFATPIFDNIAPQALEQNHSVLNAISNPFDHTNCAPDHASTRQESFLTTTREQGERIASRRGWHQAQAEDVDEHVDFNFSHGTDLRVSVRSPYLSNLRQADPFSPGLAVQSDYLAPLHPSANYFDEPYLPGATRIYENPVNTGSSRSQYLPISSSVVAPKRGLGSQARGSDHPTEVGSDYVTALEMPVIQKKTARSQTKRRTRKSATSGSAVDSAPSISYQAGGANHNSTVVLNFLSFDEAKEWRPSTHWEPPKNDATVPDTTEKIEFWLRELIAAVRDISQYEDSATSTGFRNRWVDKDNPKSGYKAYYTTAEIEVACWKLLQMIMDLHDKGISALISTDKKAILDSRKTEKWTFEVRINKVIFLLARYKARCDSVMSGSALEKIVSNPEDVLRSSRGNSISNKQRQKDLMAGRKVGDKDADGDIDEEYDFSAIRASNTIASGKRKFKDSVDKERDEKDEKEPAGEDEVSDLQTRCAPFLRSKSVREGKKSVGAVRQAKTAKASYH